MPFILHFTFYDIAFLGAVFISLTLSLFLWITPKENQAANRWLAILMTVVALWIIRVLAGDIGLIKYIPCWNHLPFRFSITFGPFIYFYVRQITQPKYIFRRKDLLHFIPLLPELTSQIFTVTLKIKVVAAISHKFNSALQLFAFLSVATYLYLCHAKIVRFYQEKQFRAGDRCRNEFLWLDHLLAGLAVAWLLWIPFTAVDYFYYRYELNVQHYYPLYLLLISMIIWMAGKSHLKAGTFDAADINIKPLLPSDLKQKGSWLKLQVKEKRYYRDAELSLASLAEKLGMHTHEVSRVINTVFKKSFNDFINEYRVREIALKMQDPSYDHITLLGLAYESGFNSQSSFHRIFKQFTGKTPLEYKNHLQKVLPTYNLRGFSQPMPLILNHANPPGWARETLTGNIMVKNYFKIAFRGFWKHKLFTLINIIGLSIGISASLAIYFIVHHDFTFDKFHKDSDRIYRVVMNMSFQGHKNYSSGVFGPLAGAIKSEATGIEEITPVYSLWPRFVYIDKDKNAQKRFKDQDRITLADQQYFKIFNYVWLAGSSQHALDAPGQVVLTSQQARLYFPSLSYHDMIGKVITYDTLKTTVSGIVETFTQNSDFTFHDFISFSTATTNKQLADDLHINNWGRISGAAEIFIKLAPGVPAPGVVKQINTIFKKNDVPPIDQKMPVPTINLALQPLDDIHFNPDYNIFNFSLPTSKTTLYGLSASAIFLLLLACINYVNLTTAQSAQRAKEIGILKTLGSSRIQLVAQFLGETFFITLFAVCISMLLAPLILKMFADVISPDIHANMLRPDVLLFLLILTIVISILSGFYPAMVLSGYKPAMALKNQVQGNSSKTRSAWLRKSLTVSQFVVAQFFMMATILVSRQIYYALHKNLGFKKDAILLINTPWETSKISTNQVLLNEFRLMPQVALVGLGNDAPSSDAFNRTRMTYNDGKKQITTEEIIVKSGDENYIKIYQIKLLAGRNITEADTGKAIIINNTYAKLLGFTKPNEAIGKQLDWFGGRKVSIIGVVADFNQRSLHSNIYPSILTSGSPIPQPMRTLHVSLKPETTGGKEWKTAIENMGEALKKAYPDDDFDCHFYDETIARFYDEEQHTSTLLSWATGFSILISCLGLLGLAIYTTNQRTKEIGIRKVFGASVAQIVILLSTELVSLILLAFIIVTPIAWYAVNKWLENFADHVAISWWIFVISGAGMLLTGLFTLSFRTISAGMAAPVKSLRNE
ncbi:ABC-type antimicrobial peptide transport system permease subunit [Mucilaginibacter oryzae]|uniref:ABC-type antimicrobial peptide transport system permease subunit n=2 Tax=Mucilaginibacter oryzae TaxID=468058 RepID=A0A316H9G9_9SPHI|nr:ABC-type antimicrobial peptide transport system permease subunit [Mucilaginibacter oryzae]